MKIKQWYIQVWQESLYYEKTMIEWVPCQTLILHGAGESDITRTMALRQALYVRWIPTLAFDFSWHGKSTSHEPISIRKRINEAREVAYKYLDIMRDIQVIGFSMSGEVSIRLTESLQIMNLILFAPWIYHHDAINLPFWDKFRTLLQTPESWKQNQISDILESYRWFLLLLTPENDTVIPPWVNDVIMESAPMAYKKHIIIPDAPHTIGKWMNENPSRIEAFIDHLQLR